ncbi:hypothetical protein COV56_03130 [Candidatus Kuenenbacteria bacterium CG11_big_fil_rev_8_21_14_0_20_37_9]|uniref:Uncharacterized protein n=2 Tax=Candidatus Kueneniibacteriota TaxID=1752740 RepID=A0A2M6XRV1_9BACT|nr:MAG: hypothetical protein AUJ29_03370 [Candidatus Kuenenbacteria bacterium CG1_02_38_13]PIR05376.1 MAG: hypothetical protein COV56_03130 [Candidatus Kuenenbacteria bacterium CG11_big_fil_rev_8_21_14_0_20_37_9]PIU10367.1 MAG: hypothetical protein COT27_03490 [Candidatus Kuenenbacteria bacterium CG08_land_8_20_14_0_20_37_23]
MTTNAPIPNGTWDVPLSGFYLDKIQMTVRSQDLPSLGTNAFWAEFQKAVFNLLTILLVITP